MFQRRKFSLVKWGLIRKDGVIIPSWSIVGQGFKSRQILNRPDIVKSNNVEDDRKRPSHDSFYLWVCGGKYMN